MILEVKTVALNTQSFWKKCTTVIDKNIIYIKTANSLKIYSGLNNTISSCQGLVLGQLLVLNSLMFCSQVSSVNLFFKKNDDNNDDDLIS